MFIVLPCVGREVRHIEIVASGEILSWALSITGIMASPASVL
jgi:hypothetical protein